MLNPLAAPCHWSNNATSPAIKLVQAQGLLVVTNLQSGMCPDTSATFVNCELAMPVGESIVARFSSCPNQVVKFPQHSCNYIIIPSHLVPDSSSAQKSHLSRVTLPSQKASRKILLLRAAFLHRTKARRKEDSS